MPRYVSVEDVKTYLRVPDNPGAKQWVSGELDGLVEQAIDAAEETIDDTCDTKFGMVNASDTATIETVWATSPFMLKVPAIAYDTPLKVVVYGGTVLDTDSVNPVNADRYRWAISPSTTRAGTWLETPDGLWSPGEPHMVTAIFGWPMIPHAVRQAAMMQGGRYFARRESPLGYSWGGSAPGFYPMRLDPDIFKMLGTVGLVSMVN